jgi:chitinase
LTWYAPAGSHQLKATAYDNSGASTTSIVNITVTSQPNTPPTVSITSPANGAVFAEPANITITATATDNVSVSKVEFYRSNVLIGTDNTSPYSFAWSNVAAGTYALIARAYDNLNASAISASVSITVLSARETISQEYVENNKLFIQTNRKLYSVPITPN